MRLGTPALKLSDATDTPTAPAVLYTAQATIVTAPASQATGLGVLLNYTPVTAQFDAIVSTQSAVTAVFEAKINRVSPITAAITVGISATTQQVQAFSGTTLGTTTQSGGGAIAYAKKALGATAVSTSEANAPDCKHEPIS